MTPEQTILAISALVGITAIGLIYAIIKGIDDGRN